MLLAQCIGQTKRITVRHLPKVGQPWFNGFVITRIQFTLKLESLHGSYRVLLEIFISDVFRSKPRLQDQYEDQEDQTYKTKTTVKQQQECLTEKNSSVATRMFVIQK